MMDLVQVALGESSYPIYIGAGLLDDSTLIKHHIAGQQVLVVTNTTVAPLFLSRLTTVLQAFHVEVLELPDGEQYKTLESLDMVLTALLQGGHNRGTTLIALGGGVVGDTTGFAAACYQRGVAFIQIPTTLLAQVDSSVGGKTAVNHPLGKNMIGAFHQPKAVIIDPQTLQSLPPRELLAGMAEVIKHGALADLAYFEWLEENIDGLLALDLEKMTYAIKRSCEIKANIVSLDEKELGARALLNLGHTFGHAIETGMGYGAWLHGEAVAAGMIMAARLSTKLGMCSASDTERLIRLIQLAGLPTAPPASLADQFLALMARDKKATDAGLRLVLLNRLGEAVLVDNVDQADLTAIIHDSTSKGSTKVNAR
ncbi:MAG: 3-dehydroquinate synthase [Cyclobacteriaceae bacterium]|jgi:3-dehydroquinate synthase